MLTPTMARAASVVVASWTWKAGRKPPSAIFMTRASGSVVDTRGIASLAPLCFLIAAYDDGGDRTHLVIGRHLGVEVDPPQVIWPRCARWTRAARAPAAPGNSARPTRRVHRRPGPTTGAGSLTSAGRRPLVGHGPARFQPARKSQVSAGGNARSDAPADEYGST